MSGLKDEELAVIIKGPLDYFNKKKEGFKFTANH